MHSIAMENEERMKNGKELLYLPYSFFIIGKFALCRPLVEGAVKK
jgi:hypothetical protein